MMLAAGSGSVLLWLVWLVPAAFAALAVHELGHAVAGALAGFRIVSCGIGLGRPLLRFRVLGVIVYIARDKGTGLTLGIPPQLRPGRGASIAFVLGGVAANGLSVLAMLGLLRLGVESTAVNAFLLASAFHLGNLVPFSLGSDRFRLRSDGLELLRLLKRAPDPFPPGVTISTVGALRDLCAAVDAWPGTVRYTLALIEAHRSVHDSETARHLLDSPCLLDPRRGDFDRGLELLIRAALAVDSKHEDATTALQAAREAARVDPVLQCALLLVEADHAHGQGDAAGDLVRRSLAVARAEKWHDLEAVAETQMLSIEPPDDPWAACKSIIDRKGARKPGELTQLAALTVATTQLAARGEPERAQSACVTAMAHVTTIAGSLLTPELRERFVRGALKPLQQALEDVIDAPGLLAKLPVQRRAPPSRPILLRVPALALAGALLMLIILATSSRRPSRPQRPSASAQLRASDDARVANLGTRVRLLRSLREAKLEASVEAIEDALDAAILAVARAPMTPSLRLALGLAREYRVEWPRKTADPAHDEAVAKVLSGVP